MTTTDIVAKLWNLCNILKDDGVTYHQYVTELTYLLFLKMARETGEITHDVGFARPAYVGRTPDRPACFHRRSANGKLIG